MTPVLQRHDDKPGGRIKLAQVLVVAKRPDFDVGRDCAETKVDVGAEPSAGGRDFDRGV